MTGMFSKTNGFKSFKGFNGYLAAVLMVILIASTGCSATVDSKQVAKQVERAKNPGADYTVAYDFAPDVSEDQLMATLTTLASKDNARVTGFEGERIAADYISEQFKSLGFEASEQSFPVKAFQCEKVAVNVVSDGNRNLEAIRVLNFSSPTPKDGLTSELVSVGMGTDADFKDKAVKGKIVLVQRGGEYYRIKVARAAQYGAIGAVFYDPNTEEAIAATLGETSLIPGVSLTRADGETLENSLNGDKAVVLKLTVDSSTTDSESQNILGLLKSKNNPDGKRLIVGAHYDSVDTPGANDNASGVAAVLEIARLLVTAKVYLPYDIQFIAFGAEEIGLIGSTHFVDTKYSTDGVDIIGMVNFDMVGVGDTINLATTNGQGDSNLVKQALSISDALKYQSASLEMESSDHVPFAYSGVSSVMIYGFEDHNYHTDLDTIANIEMPMLKQICNLGAILCAEYTGE